MKKRSNSKRPEKGQSMVELALTITILMILLAGVVDLGRAFFTYMAMRDAAQEGAAYGSINPFDDAGIKSRVWDNLEQVVSDPAQVTDLIDVNLEFNGPARCLGYEIVVNVDYKEFPLTMPFLGWILNSQTIDIHATIKDNILKPPCH